MLTAVAPLPPPSAPPPATAAFITAVDAPVKVGALVPLNRPAVTPVKFVPLMVTFVPAGPPGGLKSVMVGGTSTVKLLALDAVPPDVVTLNGPVVAPAGTAA